MRRGFKAGSLNNTLRTVATDAEFFAVADADSVLPPDFVRRLVPYFSADPAVAAAGELARYAAILAQSAPIRTTEAGPAFSFPAHLRPTAGTSGTVVLVTEANSHLLHPLLSAWVPDVRQSPPLMALVENGRAVAVCASVRITPRAHEAGVDTAAEFRGRGYAPIVVAEWARAVRALGAEPLYSTSWQNAASRAVARKLSLVQFGSDLHIT